ncbi:MAG: hypothetical protein ACRDXB_22270, partial [Actinomycetes bacterium]
MKDGRRVNAAAGAACRKHQPVQCAGSVRAPHGMMHVDPRRRSGTQRREEVELRECEMKFRLDDASSALDLTERLLDLDGSVHIGSRTELDCVVDTDDYAMRTAGLLLRHRVVRRGDDVSEIVTLKI